jgi:hypothetical protein
MIGWIVKAVLSPLIGLGDKYLDNQKDKERLKHGTTRVAYEADAAVRKVKLADKLLRLPLFVAEMSVAMYVAAIMIDSTWPSDYINPLELPNWFKPHFHIAIASIFGISTFERVINRRR